MKEGSELAVAAALVVLLLPGSALAPGPGPDGCGAAGPRAPGELIPLASGTGDTLLALDWAPDGSNALIAGDNGTVLKHEPPSSLTAIQQGGGITFLSVAFSPDRGGTIALLAGFERTGPAQRSGLLLVYNGSGLSGLDAAAYREILDVAWAPDGSAAYLVAKKGAEGAILEYREGALREVLADPGRELTAICAGSGGFFVGGYDFANQSACILTFNGTSVTGGVTLQGAPDFFPRDIAWSSGAGLGLCVGYNGNLLSFNATSAERVLVPAEHMLSGASWSPGGAGGLVSGWDNQNPAGTSGLLYLFNGSSLRIESSGALAPLRAVCWAPSGRSALVAGENGTVARYSLPNRPPVCAIDHPGAGAVVAGELEIRGSAEDPDGDALELVEVRVDDGPWVRASGGESWSLLWDTSSVPNGGHTIYARAFDGIDHSAEDSRLVYVSNPNRPPSVGFVEPAEGAGVAGEVAIRGVASDPDAGDSVELVEVSVDGGPWAGASGAEVWSYIWNTTALPDGPHTLRARAWDGEAHSEEAARAVVVENMGPNAPPVCSISFPLPGAVVTGLVRIEGSAGDSDQGVRAVWVRIDGGEWREATGGESWFLEWDTAPEAPGEHRVSARASDGIVSSSDAAVTVRVNHFPVCRIVRPSEGAVVSGEVEVAGTALDPDPQDSVAWVEVRVDDGRWLKATGAESWSLLWSSSAAPAGRHTIWARCFDGVALSEPAQRNITLEKPPSAVALAFPVDVGEDYVFLQWSQSADPDFARYEVFASESERAPLSGLAPRVILAQSVTVYNYTGLRPSTTYWFRVRVVDSSGLTSVSNEVWATTLKPNSPPVASLTASRTRVLVGETVRFDASASYDPDRGGRVVRYEWDFEGGERFPVDTSLVSSVRHEFRSPGRHAVRVRVTDDRGASSIASVNVTVVERAAGGTGAAGAAAAG
ncbi:MAG: Ig-like domain-containing protein, partial [Thermoplasmatota archaeon]